MRQSHPRRCKSAAPKLHEPLLWSRDSTAASHPPHTHTHIIPHHHLTRNLLIPYWFHQTQLGAPRAPCTRLLILKNKKQTTSIMHPPLHSPGVFQGNTGKIPQKLKEDIGRSQMLRLCVGGRWGLSLSVTSLHRRQDTHCDLQNTNATWLERTAGCPRCHHPQPSQPGCDLTPCLGPSLCS